MAHFEEARRAADELRAEDKAEKRYHLNFEQKTFYWWTARMCFTRFMFQEHAERGYDAQKARETQKAYFAASKAFQEVYNEEFDPMARPIDVAEECPLNVDRRVS